MRRAKGRAVSYSSSWRQRLFLCEEVELPEHASKVQTGRLLWESLGSGPYLKGEEVAGPEVKNCLGPLFLAAFFPPPPQTARLRQRALEVMAAEDRTSWRGGAMGSDGQQPCLKKVSAEKSP